MKKIVLSIAGLLMMAAINFAQTPLTTAVDFTATDTDGNSHTLFSYLDAGKYVVLDFFFVD
ncbi:MAG: hypothetical protein ABIJ16_01900 [Bacteroidota bacterium]